MKTRIDFFKKTSLMIKDYDLPFQLKQGTYKVCTKSKWMIYNGNDAASVETVKRIGNQLAFNQEKIRHKSRRVFISLFDFFLNSIYSNNTVLNEEGTIGVIITTNRGLVGINTQDSELIISCGNSDIYYKQKATYNFFSKHFLMPKQVFSDNNIIIEEYIQSSNQGLDIEHIRSIINDYASFFSKNESVTPVLKKEVFSSCHVPLKSLLKKFLGDETPIYNHYYIHGDLDIQNIIISENNTAILIDWEMASVSVFFSDIVNLVVTSYTLTGNTQIVSWYFDGKFDKELMNLFECADAVFDPFLKDFYIVYYFNSILDSNKFLGSDIKKYDLLVEILKIGNIL